MKDMHNNQFKHPKTKDVFADMFRAEKKKEYDKLDPIYQELASKMIDPHPMYSALVIKKLFPTLVDAKIVRELPATIDEIAGKLKLDKKMVTDKLNNWVKRGHLLQMPSGIPKMLGNTAQYADILVPNPAYDYDEDRGDELLDLIKYWFIDPDFVEDHYRSYKSIEVGGNVINRVLPRWKAIKDIPGVMPCEDLREVLKAYADRLSNTRCFCRTIINGRHCAIHEGTTPHEGHCIHFGAMAEYYAEVVEMTSYRTVEEILKVVEATETTPVYQMVGNIRDCRFICICCDCCCLVAGTVKKSKVATIKNMLSPSRFLAIVDPEKCTESGLAYTITKCPFHAIEIKNGKAHIDADKCFGCGNCVINSPDNAFKLKMVRPPEHIPDEGPQLVDQFILELGVLPNTTGESVYQKEKGVK